MLFCPAGRDRSILSPAGGLLAAGLSLIGLPSLVPPATAPPSPSPPCRTLPPSLAADTATPLVFSSCFVLLPPCALRERILRANSLRANSLGRSQRARSAFPTSAVGCESHCIGAYVGPACACARASASLQLSGPGSSILGPAGGLRAAGLSFIGLPGHDLRYATLFSALRGLSNAACCCSCAPPRGHPGPCRSHYRHPSPGHPQVSISALLTHRFGRSCLVSVFSVCPRVGLLRRLERLLRPPGRPPGRWEQRGHWPQRVRRRRRRIGRQCISARGEASNSGGNGCVCEWPFGRLVLADSALCTCSVCVCQCSNASLCSGACASAYVSVRVRSTHPPRHRTRHSTMSQTELLRASRRRLSDHKPRCRSILKS